MRTGVVNAEECVFFALDNLPFGERDQRTDSLEGKGHTMKRAVIGGLGVLALAAAPAMAADIPVKAPVMAPVVAPIAYNWNGFYIGGNVGYGWGKNTAPVRPGADAFSTAFWTPAFAAGAAPGSFGFSQDGFVGGLQIGYNWHFGSWLLGFEADAQYSGIKDSLVVSTLVPGFVPATFTASQDLRWFGTFRGRVGLTFDAAMIYVTGGGAYGRVDYGYTLSAPLSLDFHTLAASKTQFGWTVGGGLEYSFGGNWSVKGEYLYVDLGDESFLTTPSGRALNLLSTLRYDAENRYHIARLGLNYRFSAPAPVVARY